MNIVYILPVYWPAIGGCEIHTRELAGRMAKQHAISVVTLINSQEEKLASENLWKATTVDASGTRSTYVDRGAHIHKISFLPSEKRLLYPFLKWRRVYRWVEPISMRLLTKTVYPKLAPFIADCGLIHAIFGGLSYLSYTALRMAKQKGIPFVFTPLLHLSDDMNHQGPPRPGRGNGPAAHRLHLEPMGYHDRYWLRTALGADRLITMTEYERRFFVRSMNIEAEKIHAVGVGPVLSDPADAIGMREKLGIPPHKKIVLFLGRNHEMKGIEALCLAARRVWKRHPETVFLFAGPKEGNAKIIFQKYKDPHMITMDHVSLEEKTGLLADCDIFCLPSIHESFGGVFLEAWQFEKPVIGCDIPPVRELNQREKGGFLVNPVPEDIASRIICLLENPDLARAMGKWGKQRVMERHNWNWITNCMERIYCSLDRAH